ncbi:MAG TPA: hypothetical protein VG248_18160 [Caulobacteraceae bacterium]|jgi:hypothetical protein|nr:hypothetical protein [Caulobacteraceae bacterium]
MTDTTQGGAGKGAASGDPASTAKTMASSAKETLTQDGKELASQAQHKAQEAIEEHKQTATDTLSDFASAIRKAGDDLAQNDQSMAGRVVRQAADSVEQLSRSLSQKKPSELLDAARDFGRRNPLAFAGGAVLLGIALGRFIRSSESHSSDDDNVYGGQWAGGYGGQVSGQIGGQVGGQRSASTGAAGRPSGGGAQSGGAPRFGLEDYGSTSGQSLPGGVAATPEAAYDTTLTSGASAGTSGAGALSGDFGTAGGSTPQEGPALTGGDATNRSFQP